MGKALSDIVEMPALLTLSAIVAGIAAIEVGAKIFAEATGC
ncbi:hypothetical protein [Cedecea sp. NFIX57]|jgi:hypothetical protein|nr:hypothetical protein [Cedecea sp. NFIX57]